MLRTTCAFLAPAGASKRGGNLRCKDMRLRIHRRCKPLRRKVRGDEPVGFWCWGSHVRPRWRVLRLHRNLKARRRQSRLLQRISSALKFARAAMQRSRKDSPPIPTANWLRSTENPVSPARAAMGPGALMSRPAATKRRSSIQQPLQPDRWMRSASVATKASTPTSSVPRTAKGT